LGVQTWEGKCLPSDAATTYEISPFEFGSWDKEVAAFTPTQYLGTTLVAGKPTGECIENYDNLGYILGTSSNLFNELCLDAPTPSNTSDNVAQVLASYLDAIHEVTTEDEYALYQNPFYEYSASTGVSAQDTLHLVDGGEAMQNNPIFPFLQPDRNISVILVNDNSADTSNNFPNGSEILQTYQQAQSRGYTRMPYIPPASTFVSEGLNKRATFFGCDDDSVATIVYLPNTNYTYASNVATSDLQYSKSATAGIIANGVQIASQDGDANWGTCLGCAIMKKTGQALPSDCTACFTKYCYCQ
jgi:lysophospholipase